MNFVLRFQRLARVIRAGTLLLLALFAFLPCAQAATQPAPTPSPTPSPEPESPELKRLNEQLAIAQAQQKIAEAEKGKAEADKAKRAAQLPSGDVKALEGKTTVDDKATQEPVTIAYLALRAVAQQVAKDIKASITDSPGRIVIYDADQVAAAAGYRAFIAQTALLTEQYDTNLKEAEPLPEAGGAPLAAIGAVDTAARGVLDVLSLFRSDVDIKGVDVQTEESALVASLAEAASPLKVVYPKVYPLDVDTFKDIGSTLTLKRLRELMRRKGDAFAIASRLDDLKAKVETLKAEQTSAAKAVSAARTAEEKKKAEEHAKEVASLLQDRTKRLNEKYTPEMKAKIEKLRALNTACEAYLATLTKPDDKGNSLLATLISGEFLVRTILGTELGLPNAVPGYMVFLKVHKAGGNTKITRNLWTLFSGARVQYSGGAVVSYILFNHDGTIRRAGTHYQQTGYGKFKSPGKDFAGASF